MTCYYTLDEILNLDWTKKEIPTVIRPWREYSLPSDKLSLRDIKTWELIFRIPGGISLWAAWNPYAEYYIIVHELFKNTEYGIEEFFGKDAEAKVINSFKNFGIDLPLNKTWLDKDHLWMKNLG